VSSWLGSSLLLQLKNIHCLDELQLNYLFTSWDKVVINFVNCE
jgi:hypothetical protein